MQCSIIYTLITWKNIEGKITDYKNYCKINLVKRYVASKIL